MTERRRATIREIPGLHRRVRTGRGLDHLRELADGRVVCFDLDPRDNVVFIFEVVAELPCPNMSSLDIIIEETVAEMNEESQND